MQTIIQQVARRLYRAAAALAVMAALLCNSATAADLSGSWQGRWESFSSGHEGPLRAELVRLNEHQYRADFSGRFFVILPFRYSVVLDVVEDGDVVTLAGQSYLGRLFGTFTYQAEATASHFTADYRSCEDCGRFTLQRCHAACHRCLCPCEPDCSASGVRRGVPYGVGLTAE